jgi:hypothetical protein
VKILDKVTDTVEEVVVDEQPVGEGETVQQVGETVVPICTEGGYYPVAGGTPSCFAADTLVHTPSGPKFVSELRIGDMVLSAVDNTVSKKWGQKRTPCRRTSHRLSPSCIICLR